MKTATGLLELPVVRVNGRGGGMPPWTPPLLVMSRPFPLPPFFVFFKKSFLANEQENIFGGRTVKVWPLYGS